MKQTAPPEQIGKNITVRTLAIIMVSSGLSAGLVVGAFAIIGFWLGVHLSTLFIASGIAFLLIYILATLYFYPRAKRKGNTLSKEKELSVKIKETLLSVRNVSESLRGSRGFTVRNIVFSFWGGTPSTALDELGYHKTEATLQNGKATLEIKSSQRSIAFHIIVDRQDDNSAYDLAIG